MTAPHGSKVAGFHQAAPPSSQTAPPPPDGPTTSTAGAAERSTGPADPPDPGTGQAHPLRRKDNVQERLTGWITDLSALQELTARLTAADTLDDALHEVLRAGAGLIGARRGMIALDTPDGSGPERTVGLGLGHGDLGQLETVPRSSSPWARLLDEPRERADPSGGTARTGGLFGERPAEPASRRRVRNGRSGWSNTPREPRPAQPPLPSSELVHSDIASDEALDARHRDVAACLGYAASYAVPLGDGEENPRIGAAVWMYDEPTEPSARSRRLLGRYLRSASRQIAHHLELARNRERMTALAGELLPSCLPLVPGVHLARRHRTGTDGGGDWYDVLPLPENAVGLSVGGVTGTGPGAVAARARLQASLRAYAVMEGEDPVAVLSDLELLLRLTDTTRSATALFAYAEPATRRVLVSGAGHCPPLVVGPRRTEYVETTLSAPLGMLACWEAPSAEVTLQEGETLLLYSDGLLHRTGEDTDRAFALLHAAAAGAPPEVRSDPDSLSDHILNTLMPDRAQSGAGWAGGRDGHPEDVVLLAARF